MSKMPKDERHYIPSGGCLTDLQLASLLGVSPRRVVEGMIYREEAPLICMRQGYRFLIRTDRVVEYIEAHEGVQRPTKKGGNRRT